MIGAAAAQRYLPGPLRKPAKIQTDYFDTVLICAREHARVRLRPLRQPARP
jgi:hypothetical protein